MPEQLVRSSCVPAKRIICARVATLKSKPASVLDSLDLYPEELSSIEGQLFPGNNIHSLPADVPIPQLLPLKTVILHTTAAKLLTCMQGAQCASQDILASMPGAMHDSCHRGPADPTAAHYTVIIHRAAATRPEACETAAAPYTILCCSAGAAVVPYTWGAPPGRLYSEGQHICDLDALNHLGISFETGPITISRWVLPAYGMCSCCSILVPGAIAPCPHSTLLLIRSYDSADNIPNVPHCSCYSLARAQIIALATCY